MHLNPESRVQYQLFAPRKRLHPQASEPPSSSSKYGASDGKQSAYTEVLVNEVTVSGREDTKTMCRDVASYLFSRLEILLVTSGISDEGRHTGTPERVKLNNQLACVQLQMKKRSHV